jgi:hypothetical protein
MILAFVKHMIKITLLLFCCFCLYEQACEFIEYFIYYPFSC